MFFNCVTKDIIVLHRHQTARKIDEGAAFFNKIMYHYLGKDDTFTPYLVLLIMQCMVLLIIP